MDHIKLTLEYDGARYAGWQTQKNGLAIQDCVTRAIKRLTGEGVKVQGASRTDAGVHALGQVAAFKSKKTKTCREWQRNLNGVLPKDIVVVKVTKVSEDFHPTHGAKSKTYRYSIHNDSTRSALDLNRSWYVRDRLNVAAMTRASHCLLGRHDFKTFRGRNSSTKTNVRTIKTVSCKRQGKKVVFEITGDGFLKYMVRNIVGTLVEVGKGSMRESDFYKILQGKDRKKAGVTAPALALTLIKVDY
jgi:tRNA pseudouridine38-40 synthase